MICKKCGSTVPKGGFLCRNCGADCRGFVKDIPTAPKKLVYDEAPEVKKKHMSGFVSATEEAIDYGYNVNHESKLDKIDRHGRLYNPNKKKLRDEVKPYALVLGMGIVSVIVLIMTVVSVVWMFVYAEEIGDVAQNVFVTEFIKALAVAVGMVGLSFSAIIYWMSKS